jgi:hypothetical protein
MKCRRDSGRIAFIRGVSPDVRYVGKCDDCGIATEPTSLASADLALNAHYGIASRNTPAGSVTL